MSWKRSDATENFFGTEVKDPYRWLEDEEDPQTQEWTHVHRKLSDKYFSEGYDRDGEYNRLKQIWNYKKYFVPEKVNGQLFYQFNDGLQNQACLYMKWKAAQKLILDPVTLSEDGTTALIQTSVSKDGRYLAYSTAVHGSDWQQIRIKDLSTGQDLPEKIDWVKFTSIAWDADNRGFYYSRFPEKGTVEKKDENNFNKVYYHALHSFQNKDDLIYEHPEQKELLFTPIITEDHKYLCLNVNEGTASQNRFYCRPADEPDSPFIRLLDQQDAEYTFIGNTDSTLYFKTDLHAPKGRIISVNIEKPERENWREVIPEKEETLERVMVANGKFVAVYLDKAVHKISVYGLDGQFVNTIPLPAQGSLTGITASKDDREMFFGITTYLNPGIIYVYDMETENLQEWARSEPSFPAEDYKTEQVFYKSKDGTEISMFLTHKKDLMLTGQNRVLLYGYGGFNISVTPSFNPGIVRWLEQGGIYAVANLRGGGEYGEEWHKAGMLEKKQNVFDDFIAAAEWLINENYTKPEKLAIMGASNGGLLTAASMVQRPDLFGAVICRVPVIDMLRYHKFTIGRYWMPEYGDPEKDEQFSFLYRYSPLHNLSEGETYPPVLIATAESDDRVVPAHAKKFAAALKDIASSDSKAVLRLEAKAGHGLGKPTSKQIEEWADFYTFLNKELD
ncbi:prolyl oligopeptidase family serine peptidase [Salipaludibacillus sp. CUR1]|uniref:prolyl oligopeptidase family serine peptidase n=1 Tax=Salipaludibacillus sp. CUR1 TaxID=2820003 RepID=UPI001E2A95DC|nr:prolyl oligopeptidase family serine peptidase [Salipaludibacillus sp. CUR1]MCE7791979.1 prolyl oligopeptidase family serine peptidase [Salipaludibacillus sp. CUR1]